MVVVIILIIVSFLTFRGTHLNMAQLTPDCAHSLLFMQAWTTSILTGRWLLCLCSLSVNAPVSFILVLDDSLVTPGDKSPIISRSSSRSQLGAGALPRKLDLIACIEPEHWLDVCSGEKYIYTKPHPVCLLAAVRKMSCIIKKKTFRVWAKATSCVSFPLICFSESTDFALACLSACVWQGSALDFRGRDPEKLAFQIWTSLHSWCVLTL